MIPILLLALAAQASDNVEEWVKRLSDDSIEARTEAARELASRGRAAVPLVKKVLDRSAGPGRLAAEQVLRDIDRADAVSVLRQAGHSDVAALVEVNDESFSKVLPTGTVYVLPPGDGAAEGAARIVVVGDVQDAKGPARLLKGPEDIPAALAGKTATDEASVVGIARAAALLLRAMRPKAHCADLIPGPELADQDETWRLTEGYKLSKKDGIWTVGGIRMFFGHDVQAVTVTFGADGKLAALKVEYTGRSCK